jgi:hypothetical protein
LIVLCRKLKLVATSKERISMSGSSGGGGFSENREVDCEDLRFTTQLASPQLEAVEKLSVGQVLQVAIITMNAVQVLVVQVKGATAGSLIGSSASRLRECILKGHRYQATVTGINGGQVTLTVEHA